MNYMLTFIAVVSTILTLSNLTASNAAPREAKHAKHKSSPAILPLISVTPNTFTRLRAAQPVILKRTGKGIVELRHVNVEITNVGSVRATGIQVSFEQNGGLAYTLRGPRTLEPRARAVYLLNSRVLAGQGSWNVVSRCANCWR
jgi:hypothetical protein